MKTLESVTAMEARLRLIQGIDHAGDQFLVLESMVEWELFRSVDESQLFGN